MKAEIREALGKAGFEARKAAFDAKYGDSGMPWEEVTEDIRELYRIEAETTVKKLAEMLVPVLQLMLSEDDVKRLLEQLRGAES